MKADDLLGRVVRSTAGRDEGKTFIIIKVLDEKYVVISDGNLRTQEKPKKKKIKHLAPTNIVAEEIRDFLLHDKSIGNATIRKFLQLNDGDKEV